MKKLLLAGFVILAMSGMAMAGDFPRVEIFGGYSYLRSDLQNNSPFMDEYYYGDDSFQGAVGNLNGFETSFTYNLNKWLGVKADVSGYFGEHQLDDSWYREYDDEDEYYYYNYYYEQQGKANVRQYFYLFGPEFSYRGNSAVRPFAHALFGFNRANVRNFDINYLYENYYYYDDYYYEGSVTGSFCNTGFAMALGGGLDINAGDNFAIRLFQIDYLPTFHQLKGEIEYTEDQYYGQYPDGSFSDTESGMRSVKLPHDRFNNLRLSAGVVIKF